MRYLKADEVLLIHERILDKFGGGRGLRDWGLLDSAVKRPRAAFEGMNLYPDLFTKAAGVRGKSCTTRHWGTPLFSTIPLLMGTSGLPGRRCTPSLRRTDTCSRRST